MGTWKKISTKKVFETKWFYIDEDKLLTPSGKDATFYTLRKPACMIAIPFDGKQIYLVKVFRPSLFKYSWELPMGGVENDSDQKAASRELQEETGFTADKWTYLGQLAFANGIMDQSGKVYLAEDLKKGQANRDDAEEDMEVKAFSLAEIDDMIAHNKIWDGPTIASFYFFKEHLKSTPH
jgi:8-oxo-dGTP pyrophosphatase MutT (NUDIX family)